MDKPAKHARPRPYVTVYSEVSADGKTTHRRGASSKPMMDLEDEDIRRYRHALRAEAHAIMVGSGTLRLDDPSLTVRHVRGRNPLRVIVSADGDLPLTSRVFTDGQPTLVALGRDATEDRIDALRATGAQIEVTDTRTVNLPMLLERLRDRDVATLIVEGGATLLASFFRLHLVDKLIVQHLPVIFGGSATPSMVGGPPLRDPRGGHPLRLVEVKRVGAHAVIVYECLHEEDPPWDAS